MGRFSVAMCALAVTASWPAAAWAQDGEEEERFDHEGQFDVNLQFGLGYRGIFTYDEEFCGDVKDDGTGENKTNCLGRSPFAIDVAFGYGLLDKLELFLQMRVGIEEDFGETVSAEGTRLFAISPGIRGYLADLGKGRFASTAQLWIDLTDYAQFDQNDVGVRNTNAFHYDLHKTFGIYAYFGEIFSWRRWFRFEVEAGVGVQARFP